MKSELVAPAAVFGLVLVGGFFVWRAYKGAAGMASDAVDAVAQAAEQGAAEVAQAWGNLGTTAEPEKSSRWMLNSDYYYTGIDPATGLSVVGGEWYGNADARRYDIEQQAAGAAPAATSVNGAAFGVYPSAGKRSAKQAPRAGGGGGSW